VRNLSPPKDVSVSDTAGVRLHVGFLGFRFFRCACNVATLARSSSSSRRAACFMTAAEVTRSSMNAPDEHEPTLSVGSAGPHGTFFRNGTRTGRYHFYERVYLVGTLSLQVDYCIFRMCQPLFADQGSQEAYRIIALTRFRMLRSGSYRSQGECAFSSDHKHHLILGLKPHFFANVCGDSDSPALSHNVFVHQGFSSGFSSLNTFCK